MSSTSKQCIHPVLFWPSNGLQIEAKFHRTAHHEGRWSSCSGPPPPGPVSLTGSSTPSAAAEGPGNTSPPSSGMLAPELSRRGGP